MPPTSPSSAKLLTRIAGAQVLLQVIPSGVGTHLWVGEFRARNGQPFLTHYPNDPQGHRAHQVRVAPYNAFGLGQVLTALTVNAELLTNG